MRRDSIFYALFQQSPTLLFELLEEPPLNAEAYRFDSVAVKEPRFEIDGVFLPPDTEVPGIVYFCEVQFQRDERLYERLFGESFLYFYRNRDRFSDWQAVVIYPARSMEQSNTLPYQDLLAGDRVHCVFLDELGDIGQLPLGVALMVLTTLEEAQAPAEARALLARSRQEIDEPAASRAIMEMLTTIMVYKFTNLSRQEIETMLGISLQQTRVYQEAKEEALQQVVINLLKEGMTVEAIARVTGLSVEQIEQLQKSVPHNPLG
ncbi:Rpn family recombination-promoting nuclease/putative transposase (plasmid) [Phormidium sp. CLA17]|uniref:Rpn family recombination-promoting nuclease/putative transposase n=1 Tax=Leptolyngbya sp. Cla-17 TaxID=2803751 RepID=UPI0014921CEF|nr:Rpn family recombination-promoting nuclease/putative transposase [Leptolyngbya sp. Cla-17]MBM0744739.1 Rpn family recombination-promoting nuclease/putative transposase [Leptolyngbya sp. Cla-17]MBM0744756.1 Rpn family recombination-promoting nuclease/putative transposase [Leptolyngbya sp. Cla-17]MBM0745129.1 Rpn family recombination-promoting nuclease/putative transposase [Leptolyngbya sp. Cla-17]MBM0745145.1 Rpn family recombination-promoting nuclease/putative transposase [Leptolyngbya sp. C